MPAKSNLGKAAVVFAVIFLLSLGLCGYGNTAAAGREPYGILALSGLGLLLGGVGLFVVGIMALTRRS